jgi:HEAT repeat protein
MKQFPILTLGCLASALMIPLALAEERTLTPEQMEALANTGDFSGEEELERPKNLPDLTNGGKLPSGKSAPPVWTLGPTGIAGQMAGRTKGEQILVKTTVKGSPSEGKFLPGDVIIGMNGKKFVAGGDLGVLIGNAIIEAEKEENVGKISFIVWRDRNLLARSGKQDMTSIDVDKLFSEARDDNSLYDWKPEEERAKEVTKMSYDKFPIDAVNLEIDLQLRTFPAYADTAPYDCPKTKQILEEAWKVLEKKFIVDPKDRNSGKGGIVEAIALVASGKPEHRKLVHDWVRSNNSPWRPPTEPIGEMFKPGYRGYKGYQSWHKGYAGLYCAIYYDATGDDYVLPALRKYAIETAMGQSWAGSWGHTFAYPSFNGGELHKMNPGYGALNAAGNRCFFLVTLAQKLGIKHPEIDQAVERARRFFGSYTDQGCIPYGDHPAYGSDDSNGKNTGVAFSMKLLGDKHKAKYFAMMSSHCAFTRRGGHGHDYHGNWSSWAATLCGPEIRMFNERNLRWRRTLCRLHDGRFIYNSPTNYGALRDPTATEVLHQSVIFGQTLITGKDPDPELYINEHEMKQMMSIASGQFNDPLLKKMAGKSWPERTTDEMLELLDVFYPKARASVAQTLGKRFLDGEKEILPRLVSLLDHEDPRFRDGALRALGSCGNDVVLENLSKISKLLEDPEDFVRITAVKVISKATDDKDTQLAMLEATVAEPKTVAPNSVRNATQGVLFGKDHPLARSPFDAGFDESLVRQALEAVMLTDPDGTKFLGSRKDVWTKDTIVKIAGPLTFIAEEEQIADQMFGNRSAPARAILAKAGYLESAESGIHLLRKKSELPRNVRPFVGYKDPLVDPLGVSANPAAFRGLEDAFRIVLIDNPNESVTVKDDRTGWKAEVFELDELLAAIESSKDAPEMPKVADDVRDLFRKELDSLDGSAARIKACRGELADPEGKNTFRKIAAMETLVEMLDVQALSDLTPFLGHSYWRLRDRSRELAANLARAGGITKLVGILQESFDPAERAGILAVLAVSNSKSGIEPARSCLKDASSVVRVAAARALTTLGGESALPEVLAHFAAARETDELSGFEEALLVGTDDPIRSAAVRDGLLKMLPGMDPLVKPSAWYVLAKLGDPKSITALVEATKTDSFSELEDIILALSYSPSREADRVLLDIAATDKKLASIVGPHSVRRMVLGPKGYGDITNSERMDFAEPMIKLSMDKRMISYLSGVLDARALRALIYCLEQGVEQAAGSLVTNAEKLEDLKPTDSKIAVEAVRNVIEYIEVNHLRGGVKAHMRKEDKYFGWKDLQSRAGKALLKLHNPATVPIPTFDPLELDR